MNEAGFDIRAPIGALFVVLGALLGGYGVWAPAGGVPLAGFDANVAWGAVMLAFGAFMLILWRRGATRR